MCILVSVVATSCCTFLPFFSFVSRPPFVFLQDCVLGPFFTRFLKYSFLSRKKGEGSVKWEKMEDEGSGRRISLPNVCHQILDKWHLPFLCSNVCPNRIQEEDEDKQTDRFQLARETFRVLWPQEWNVATSGHSWLSPGLISWFNRQETRIK